GALALLLAGTDDRIDVIAPTITYNDLAQALLPNAAGDDTSTPETPAAGAETAPGVFKTSWAGMLFAAGCAGAVDTAPSTSMSKHHPAQLRCGRFSPDIGRAYRDIALDGNASEKTLRLVHSISPAAVTDYIDIPTLLVQGEQDTLFGLEQADANARQISDAGGDVKVVWFP